ncbi:sialate O-acetylesterase [Flavobacterium gilvum]|uniref:Sialate O-acetylesterase n=1 Tax=Flavobacterium gilvum TaxID=1492737 RepID=A0AAC9N6F6_9FLAO|nr:sialate O-acetylesterase [Flavobacterium gilvum]AOW11171.1 sialate O-acetylesterase [Flavobacterium gilvum]KFC60054.1 9-O-acetylesterase [Flavobacterium gilvum]
MKIHKRAIICLIFAAFFGVKAFGAIKLPYLFSDNMVLQQQSHPLIWGWSTAGAKVNLATSWNKKQITVTADSNGKWKANVTTPVAGGPFEIKISEPNNSVIIKNVLIGEVWLCSGQSNMEMQMKGYKDQPILGASDAVFDAANDKIRLYTVPRAVEREAQDNSVKAIWNEAEPESVSNFSAAAYYFGRLLYAKLKVPIGLVCNSYGGTPVEGFMDEEALKPFPEITSFPSKTDTTQKINNGNATTVYNGMMHLFLGYTIKGCIWYQGESNSAKPKQYETLFPAFVKMLRTKSNDNNLPFYYVQIAPFNYGIKSPNLNSAYLRDAQRKALAVIPNSGMAVTMDIGSENFIHPWDKETVGKRLGYMALAQTYGLKGFPYASPMYESVSFAGNVATVQFSNTTNGLTSYGKPLSYFEIAGADKVFYPAKAVISQGKLQVSAPEVSNPVAVRYAFKDFVMGDLFNTEGFPASSFRTDDW